MKIDYSKPLNDIGPEREVRLSQKTEEKYYVQKEISQILKAVPPREACLICQTKLKGSEFIHRSIPFVRCETCGHILTKGLPPKDYPYHEKDSSFHNIYPDLKAKEYQDRNSFYILSAQHQNFIYTGINIFKENKLLGSGPKSFRHVCDNENYRINDMSCNTHPHNYYLQSLIETGIVGFLFIVLTYLYIIFRSFKNFIKIFKNEFIDMKEVIILGFYFTQLWPLMQTGSIFNNWNSIILFLPIAFFLHLREKKIEIN